MSPAMMKSVFPSRLSFGFLSRFSRHFAYQHNETKLWPSFDYYLVLDFEATCEKHCLLKPQEIIEFPVLKINACTLEEESKFHRYVRPEIHPELTPFCTKLTGIIQDMVQDEATLDTVLTDFHHWLIAEGLLQKQHTFAFVTCGDWDLKLMLPSQCHCSGISLPEYMKSWINIKQAFAERTRLYPRNLPHMLAHLKLAQIGRLHSGIDDCRNIAAVLRVLSRRNHHFRITSHAKE